MGIVRQTLRYPLLGGGFSGWSRGVPTVTGNVAELWLLDRRSKSLRRAVSVPAPRRWMADVRYQISPRVLPDETVVYTVRGCPMEEPNCTESSTYSYAGHGKPKALAAQPDVTPDESAQLRACTTYLTYTEKNTPQVSIGPTGGPWRAVMAFEDGRLAVIEAP